MKTRLAAVAAALALATGWLTGCSGPADPAATTPLFSSEDEAFAAAEATYRAYVDALNAVDLSDPETFEDVYAWTTGDANAGARESFSQMHADEWVVSGVSEPTVVEPRLAGGTGESEVQLAICLDVSGVSLVGPDGDSVIDPSRPDVQSMLITLSPSTSTDTGLAISMFDGREGDPTCD
ncbi:hypothetical protein [Microbacterium pumilum]|uniref:Lipoprotein n=1 Tax=Microbacterium pumilum TaxID=344165 RepID=A0ABP5DWY9_9MICO